MAAELEQLNIVSSHDILPPELAIKAMRDNGFKDTAHAIAELVDNSIQAGMAINDCTNVEILCVDKSQMVNNYKSRRIHRIAVFDDACGMDAQVLRMALQFGVGTHLDPESQTGMGRFGMGLPNSSISQCRRIDVYSWQDSQCLYTYLDLEEIRQGKMKEVPRPVEKEIPEEWERLIEADVLDHGTLVVWSELDRVKWKSSRAFLRNSDFLVGRMYRYFLRDGRAKIRLAAYEEIAAGRYDQEYEYYATPNDPLYLMAPTSTPGDYGEQPGFIQFGDPEVLNIGYRGSEYPVRLTFALASKEMREEGGNSAIGAHCKKNLGISIVRADRELEMDQSFVNSYDPRERWWGVEVSFPPALDEVFGVTNNKQAANAFQDLNLDEDAAAEEMSPGEYREMLERESDPRLVIYDIAQRIRTQLSTMREQIKRYGRGKQSKERTKKAAEPGSPEAIATQKTKERRELIGDKGKSDEDESLPKEQRAADLQNTFVESGIEDDDAKEIAIDYIDRSIKYYFEESDKLGTSPIFDVASKAGTIIVRLNSSHPLFPHLFQILENNEADSSGEALTSLKLLIMAWARLEDESSGTRRTQLEDIRADWGRIARDFIQGMDE